MLQTRPSSNSGMTGQQPQYMGNQAPRSPYGAPAPGYRGGSAPIQPYAFTSTPNLNQNQWQQGAYRTVTGQHDVNYRGRFPNNTPANVGYTQMGVGQGGSRDDSAIPARNVAASRLQPTSPSFTPGKAAPDRYRRPAPAQHARSQSSSLPSTVAMAYNGPNNGTLPNRPTSFYGSVPVSKDDMHLQRPASSQDDNRTRRRSVHGLESDSAEDITQLASTLRVGSHSRNGSSESVSSRTSSRPSSVSHFSTLSNGR